MKIDKKELFKLTKEIVDAPGISGHETGAAKVIISKLEKSAAEISTCGNGSVIARYNKKNDKNIRILVDAHLDELGLMVSEILPNGYLKFIPIGGWWNHNMTSQLLYIHTSEGKIIPAIVASTPIHVLPAERRPKVVTLKETYLDVGVKGIKEIHELGIKVGDPVVKRGGMFPMADKDYWCGKAMDNRISCAALAYTAMNFQTQNEVNFVFSVQEEVGCRGAQTAAYAVDPDLAIVIDTTVSFDQIGLKHNDVKLNNGIVIEVMDARIISNKKLLAYIENKAKELKLNITYCCLTAGGTNGGPVQLTKKGIPTVVLSIPTRYLHTFYEIAHVNDLINTINLLIKLLSEISKSDLDDILNVYDR